VDWTALSAIADLVAAIAVVVSLIYLATQIRDNTRHLDKTVQATRLQSTTAIIEGFDRWRDMLLDGDNVDIWARGIDDLGALNRSERMRFDMIASSFIWACWYMYQVNRAEGLVNDINGVVWQDLFRHNGFREWLLDHRRYHADSFGPFLDEVCASVGDARYEPGDSSSLFPGGLGTSTRSASAENSR
jgi:hypothetical protein